MVNAQLGSHFSLSSWTCMYADPYSSNDIRTLWTWREILPHKPICCGVRKSDGVPKHKNHEQESRIEGAQITKSGKKKNLWKLEHASKVLNPFTCALTPPFIRRRRDFYIPRLPSNLRNISNVNTYKNVFYIPWFAELISYIYKPATSSHFKPGLLKWRLWLGFFLTPEALVHEITALCDSRIETPPDSWTLQIPDSLNFASFQLSWNGQQICEQKSNSSVIFAYY
jgi:hypothetical protein